MKTKKKAPFILIIFIFSCVFFYLHQKVQIFIESYRLSRNYCQLNELIDERDFLLHNFTKETSLSKVNYWAEENNFSLAQKNRMMALNLKKEEQVLPSSIASLINRFLGLPTNLSVLAKEKD